MLLQLGDLSVPRVALVLTLWPCGSKPRPCTQEIELSRVKTFRATLLERGESSEEFVPSMYTWRYGPTQVLAILDCESAEMCSGKFVVTKSSAEALDKLWAEEPQEVSVPKDKRLRKKKGKAHHVSFKAMAGKLKGNLKKISLDEEKDVVTASEIRRSEKGRKVIRDIVLKCCEIESLQFPKPSIFDLTSQKCTLKQLEHFSFKSFIDTCPRYFQWKYFQVRNASKYGNQVHADLCQILKGLRESVPSRKGLIQMVKEVSRCVTEGHIQLND